jgi:hypothetical protein
MGIADIADLVARFGIEPSVQFGIGDCLTKFMTRDLGERV